MSEQSGYLYVDDDPPSREAMRMIVEKSMKERITILEDSTDFMQRLRSLSYRPRLILLDIHMQPYDGFTLLAMLRADPEYRDITAIALTASVMNEEVDRLKTAGFNGAIAKPFSFRTLPDLLRRIENAEIVWNITGF